MIQKLLIILSLFTISFDASCMTKEEFAKFTEWRDKNEKEKEEREKILKKEKEISKKEKEISKKEKEGQAWRAWETELISLREKCLTILEKSKKPKTLPELLAHVIFLTFCYEHYINPSLNYTSPSLGKLSDNAKFKQQINAFNKISENVIKSIFDILIVLIDTINTVLNNRYKQVEIWIKQKTEEEMYKYISPTIYDSDVQKLKFFSSHQSRYEKIYSELGTVIYNIKRHSSLNSSLIHFYGYYKKTVDETKIANLTVRDQFKHKIKVASQKADDLHKLFVEYMRTILKSKLYLGKSIPEMKAIFFIVDSIRHQLYEINDLLGMISISY